MKLGILSDTHDELTRTQFAISILRHEGADALIHCGDLTTPAIVSTLAGMPSWFVFGNSDDDMVPYLQQAAKEYQVTCLGLSGMVEVAGKRIGVTHGHLISDRRQLLAAAPDYLLTGHSHVAADEMSGTTRRINPGALHRAEEYTIAILDLEKDELRWLEVNV